jgi:hypothetical protein
VLEQAEEIGPAGGQGTADVVLGEPVELPHHHLAYPSQVVVEVLFREFADHRGKPATSNLELQHKPFIRDPRRVRRLTIEATIQL